MWNLEKATKKDGLELLEMIVDEEMVMMMVVVVTGIIVWEFQNWVVQ
jgi:hypothetical protein